MEKKLYIGNLAYTTIEDDLRALFAGAGTISSVSIIKDRVTGQSKGFAFIEMSSPAEAQQAISMFNGKRMNERELTVNIARQRNERGGFVDRRGGGRRGGRRR